MAGIKVVGYVCDFEGRHPDVFKVVKILEWPPLSDITTVRVFIGILWWGGWSRHHFSLHYSLCLGMSILRHLHTRIRESILSISLNSRLSRAIGQSPYQSRVLTITSRCVYRPSVVQLLVWIFMCVFGCFLSIIILQSYLFEGTPPSLSYWRSRCDF